MVVESQLEAALRICGLQEDMSSHLAKTTGTTVVLPGVECAGWRPGQAGAAILGEDFIFLSKPQFSAETYLHY